MEAPPHKAHRKNKAGRKAEKKKTQQKKRNGTSKEKSDLNPKAFTPSSAVNAARKIRRNLDLEVKKHHVPLVDRTPDEPPPIMVAVVGPPGVGKTTLIKSLVQHFTKHKISEPKGPITVVSGEYSLHSLCVQYLTQLSPKKTKNRQKSSADFFRMPKWFKRDDWCGKNCRSRIAGSWCTLWLRNGERCDELAIMLNMFFLSRKRLNFSISCKCMAFPASWAYWHTSTYSRIPKP